MYMLYTHSKFLTLCVSYMAEYMHCIYNQMCRLYVNGTEVEPCLNIHIGLVGMH